MTKAAISHICVRGVILLAVGFIIVIAGWRWFFMPGHATMAPVHAVVQAFDRAPAITSLVSSTPLGAARDGEIRQAHITSLEHDEIARALADRLKSAPDRRQWRPGGSPDSQGDLHATETLRASLAALVAEWFRLRAIGDADAYAGWMRLRGYRLDDNDPSLAMMDRSYAAIAGEPLPPDLPRIDLFRTLYEGALARQGGVLRPVAVGDMELRFGVCAEPRDIESQLLPDIPAPVWWTGRGVGAGRRHWLPPVTLEEVINRDGHAIGAAVYLAVKNAKDEWVTHKLYCYYDPSALEWHIHEVTVMPLSDSIIGTGVEF